MRLEEWMKQNGVTQTQLARSIGAYPNQIHNIVKGKYKPQIKLAKKIRAVTNFMVTLDDIYDIPEEIAEIEKQKTDLKNSETITLLASMIAQLLKKNENENLKNILESTKENSNV